MNAANIVEILLVEDSPADLELCLRALKKANLANHNQVARDGEEALEFIFGEGAFAGRQLVDGPKVILLDLKLPKVDGMEVLQRIKGDPRTKGIPVVVLTSSGEQRDVVESYQLGVNSYIVKPVNFERFAAAVQELGMYWLLLNHPSEIADAGRTPIDNPKLP
jgi:two-component system response regulator